MAKRTNLKVQIIALTVFSVIAVVFFLKDRLQKGKLQIGSTSASVEAAEQQAGVKAKGITSQQGGLKATDETGKGVEVTDANVAKDVELKNTSLPK